jgi:hypothetical protein
VLSELSGAIDGGTMRNDTLFVVPKSDDTIA